MSQRTIKTRRKKKDSKRDGESVHRERIRQRERKKKGRKRERWMSLRKSETRMEKERKKE